MKSDSWKRLNSSSRLGRLADELNVLDDDEIDASESLNDWIDCMHDGTNLQLEEEGNQIEKLVTQLWELGNHAALVVRPSNMDMTQSPEIDGYKIHRVIGQGGMGVVYSATEVALNRDVAIKVLSANTVSSSTAHRRFQLEVQAAAQLEHPHIVPIYRYGEYHGGLFYSMREIDGIDLSVKLRVCESDEFGPSVDIRSKTYRRWVATIGQQLAEALAHSHEQLVVHRDVKPANILIDRKGIAYLSDFGLARLSNDLGLTGEQDLLGTVLYMSPEQVAGNDAVGPSTDIYSLGATLYELLTLQPMIREETCIAALKRISDGRIPTPSSLNSAIESDLETILLKAIAPESASRYLSARALAEDLQLFLELKPIRATRATLTMRFSRWVRRNSRWVAGLSAIAGLCFLLVLGLAINSATRSAADAEIIRSQATQLLDQRGTELLLKDDVREAADNFHRVVELTRVASEKLKQQRRIEGIEAWSAKLLKRIDFKGNLIHRLPNNTYLVVRHEGENEACILIDAAGAELKLFDTNRDIEFATSSRDGGKIAIIVGDRTNRNPELKLYDTSKHLLRSLPTDDWHLTKAWFLNEGHALLTTGWGGNLSLHSLLQSTSPITSPTSVLLPQIDDNVSWVYSAEVSADKSRLVVSINPGRLLTYSLPDMKALGEAPIDLHDWSVNAIAISERGTWVAAGTDPHGIRIWHTATGEEVVLDNNVSGEPTDVEFSPDEMTLVAGDNRGGVYVWRLPQLKTEGDKLPSTISRFGTVMWHDRAIRSITFNNHSELLVSTGEHVQAWRLEDNQPITPKLGVGKSLSSANWDGEDRITFLTYESARAVEWLWQLPDSLHPIQQGQGKLSSIHSEKDGFQVAIFDNSNRSQVLATRPHRGLPSMFEILLPRSRGNQALPVAVGKLRLAYLSVAGKGRYNIHVVNHDGQTKVGPPAEIDTWVDDLRLNSSETKWIANDFSNRVFVGDVFSGQVEHTLDHRNWIEDAQFVGEDHFASICWDQRLRIWDADGSETRQFELDSRPTKLCVGDNLLIVAAGEHLYGFERDSIKGCWNERFHTVDPGESIQRLTLSPSNDRWLSCCESGSNRLWTIAGELVCEFTGEGPVAECCFSPDGCWIATLNAVGNIHIRNATTGEIMAPTIRGRSAIRTMNWTHDGVLFGGNFTHSYWLSRLTIPETWSSDSD